MFLALKDEGSGGFFRLESGEITTNHREKKRLDPEQKPND
ncbi:hypothetical protein PRUB_a3191 [Pseudoalteromonas rubra]|uniref:Uncharacterized protein n=1 Tax=Pseudoalteromonas rubra TaxID=43658 RepID=A0A8T0CCR5_9GAMM|nr:hypothetical protein PRUB_a3191 [Pseudoalteromonas rubra]